MNAVASDDVRAIRQWIVERLAVATQADPDEFDGDIPFAHYGIGSRDALTIVHELEGLVGRTLSATAMWEFPTVDALARHVVASAIEPRAARAPETARIEPALRDEPLAIVGMACR